MPSGFYTRLLLCLTLPIAAVGQTQPSNPVPAQQQLDAGEYASAITLAERGLDDGDALSLIRNLRILGEAYLALDRSEDAIDAFTRAREALRLHSGLHQLTEVDLLFGEAEALQRTNDIKAANDRHEYAFTIRKLQGDFAVQVDGAIDLALWYESNGYLSAARDLYRDAIEVAERHDPDNNVLHARLYQYVAKTYREQTFPDLAANKRRVTEQLVLRPHGNTWRDLEARTHAPWGIELYFRTISALKKSVALLKASDSASTQEISHAVRQLGDWLLLSGKYGRAFDTYAQLRASEEVSAAQPGLEQPELLAISLPRNPVIPSFGHTKGYIELLIAVDAMGQARKIRTVHIEPSFVDEIPYRRAVRSARFRPSIIDGVASYTDNVKVVLDFDSEL